MNRRALLLGILGLALPSAPPVAVTAAPTFAGKREGYRGPIMRVRGADGIEVDIWGNDSLGPVSVVALYDQSGNGRHRGMR